MHGAATKGCRRPRPRHGCPWAGDHRHAWCSCKGIPLHTHLYIPPIFYHGVCCAVHKRLALSPGVHIERSNLYCAWDTSCSSTLHYRKRRAMPKMLDSQFNQPGVSDIPLSLTDCQVVGLPIGPSSVRCNRLHNSRGAPGLWPAPCIAPAM